MKRALTQLSVLLSLAASSSGCIGWHAYEKQVAATEANALRAAEADALVDQLRACRNENQQIGLHNQLLTTELSSTRLQYVQLEHANADLLHRYDRYLTHTDIEVSANASERARLTEAASRREQEVRSARQEINLLSQAVEDREARLAAVRSYATVQPGAPAATQDPKSSKSSAVAYGEFERPNAASPNTTPDTDLRLPAACSDLGRYLAAQLTGFLPGELRVRDERQRVTVDLSLAMLFPGASQELGSLGMSAVRQLARALQGVELATITLDLDLKSAPASSRSCPACAKTVAEALVTAGLTRPEVLLLAGPPQPEPHDNLPGGATIFKSGTIRITLVPVLPEGDRHSLSGLPFDR